MAGIPVACEEAGRLLVGLTPDVAISILDITTGSIDRSAALAALAREPRTSGADVIAAFDAVWTVLETERHGRGRLPAQSVVADVDQGSLTSSLEDPRWTQVKIALEAMVPATDYSTWIAPMQLIHAEEALAVIATPNVFVRSEIQSRFITPLRAALEQVWGRAVEVEVVIETALAA
jgi:hypothetical protein